MRQAIFTLEKQLDLAKFLRRSNFKTFSSLVLLNWRQKLTIEALSVNKLDPIESSSASGSITAKNQKREGDFMGDIGHKFKQADAIDRRLKVL